jgi:hypothetical protein
MIIQYDCRRDATGWTVFDRWTGRVVILGGVPQVGLARPSADALAGSLNKRRLDGDRTILQ